jgi:carboxyl-terminal processing protease
LDQHSDYISPSSLQELRESIFEQEFGGVGIEVLMDEETKRLTVLSPMYGTPAFRAGMHAGDVILAIDNHSTEGMNLEDAVRLMRGDPGSLVRLRVLPVGSESLREIEIARAVINIESVIGDTRGPDGRWQFTLEDEPGIGYVQLITFGDKTAKELLDALGRVQPPIEGLILDLRGNAGGLLDAAVDVADLFLDEGQIVTTRDRYGDITKNGLYLASPGTTRFRMPMAILVDRYSASASEILAACLQDHQRAKIVGERTWGKGTVQNVIYLEGGRSALKLTTSAYWRPSLKNIHRGSKSEDDENWGVKPDEGYKIDLNDQQYTKLVQARRERYMSRAKSQAGMDETDQDTDVTDGTNGSDDGESGKPDVDNFEDPYMTKAIEYLREQISSRPRKAA